MHPAPRKISCFLSLMILAACFVSGLVPSARADTIVLDFEGLQSLESVEDFYDGGLGSLGSGPGPDVGINFTSDAITLLETHPEANFTNPPSGVTVLFFLTGTAVMNVPTGFDTGFSFFYTNTSFVGTVSVYDQVDAMGNELASLTLPALGACGGANPFCNWAPIGVSFAGVARSVDFSGTVNQIGFDDITLGSPTPGDTGPVPVPEPATLTLLALGVSAGIARRRQRRARDS